MVFRSIYKYELDKSDNLISCNVPVNKSIEARNIAISYMLGLDYKKAFENSCDDIDILYSAISDFSNGKTVINVGESGTAMRLMTGIISLKTDKKITLTGEGRQNQRPIKPLVDALKSIGCNISYIENEGYPPLYIEKRTDVNIKNVEVDCSQSSQFLSSLLISCLSLGEGFTIKTKTNAVSQSYAEMTLACLNSFGIEYQVKDTEYKLASVRSTQKSVNTEFDFSSISFIYEIVSLMPKGFNVLLKNVKRSLIQGDCYYSEIAFAKLGVSTDYTDDGMIITNNKKSDCQLIEMDMCNCPDLVPSFVAAMLGNRIPFKLHNIAHLRFKESDRIEAISNETKKMGYVLDVTENTISYDGHINTPNNKIELSSHHDHRIAMSLSPLLSINKEYGVIYDSDVVAKSFPNYWIEIAKLGIKTKEGIL